MLRQVFVGVDLGSVLFSTTMQSSVSAWARVAVILPSDSQPFLIA